MKPVFKSLVFAGMLATAGLTAFAQHKGGMDDHQSMMDHGGMMQHGGGGRMGKMDSGKMEAMMAKRVADLKAKLKITADQEGAWTAFTTAMKPSTAMMGNHPDRAELDKLTTPERIDKMRDLREQHMKDMHAAMDQRDAATKTFYAALNADQKKIFDAEHARIGAGRHVQGADHGKKMPPKPAPAAKQ